MVAGAVLLGALAVRVEPRAAEPMIPPRLFRNRTITLAVVASIAVGVGMFGASVFLGQYFQISRGESPTMAGLMTLPMILGLLVVLHRRRPDHHQHRPVEALPGDRLDAAHRRLRADGHACARTPPYWRLAIFMALIGLGLGMTMQNLVLAVQNTVGTHELGAASSVVAFFRSLGGAVGVSALGAVLGHRVTGYIADGLAALGIPAASSGGGGALPDVHTLPGPIRAVVECAYGHGAGDIFLAAAPFALLALIAVMLHQGGAAAPAQRRPGRRPRSSGSRPSPPAAMRRWSGPASGT